MSATHEARRSQLVSTYGVGSLFPAQDESFMILGLDDWPTNSPELQEPRLARALGVTDFRLPPSFGKKHDLPVIRFPQMHFCPNCRKLADLSEFCAWNENVCKKCRAQLVPSRFVVCCQRGHIDEFPYFQWLHQGQERVGGEHRLELRAGGRSSSLADIILSCSCQVAPTSLDGAFGADALKGKARCRGQRPWLQGADEADCTETPRTLQRGSANVWFPVVDSAISIPPWSEGIYRHLEQHWSVLKHVPREAIPATIKGLALAKGNYSVDDLVAAVERRLDDTAEDGAANGGSDLTPEALRVEEYKALVAGRPEEDRQQQFVCTPVEVHPELAHHVRQVAQVPRLREVRALRSFTRLLPDRAAENMAPLSRENPYWLPAIEVMGEGVFLRFDDEDLKTWSAEEFPLERQRKLQASADRHAHMLRRGPAEKVDVRLVLLHTFAHLLIDQFSLDAGYPSASLRERLYVSDDTSGILVYTATSDSAGSLGGVAALSDPELLRHAVAEGLSRLSWCSSDPVCIESEGSGADALNLAACHACMLLPETSCELQNTYLDRALLLGAPGHPRGGFFAALGPH